MRRAHSASDYQGNMSQRTDHQMLEEENDRIVDHLSSKVQALKSLTIDIGHEVKYQNKMLSEMVSLAFSVTGKFVLHCRYSVVFSVIMLTT